jgi:hypothetical protein
MTHITLASRRQFLAATLSAGGCFYSLKRQADEPRKALIAITLDLEMSRNFPTWDQTHWDYEKGNLNEETKKYALEACRRVKAHGGVVHCFVVGRIFEQENVDWLKQIISAGHPAGNHTYDHVNVLATRREDIQFRFRRSPWLIEGKATRDVISENIRLTNVAFRSRLGIDPVGFRTPGGFARGLEARLDTQRMLLDHRFTWVSSKYPAHPIGSPGIEPTSEVYEAIIKAQEQAQPFAYPTGLVEVPMSPISDISAYRGGRWKLDWFLRAVRLGIEWAIENRAVFDFLGHPSCLYVTDPQFRAIELICELVHQAKDRAGLVDLRAAARRAAMTKSEAPLP